MLIATWNINGIRARWGRLTEWLAERKPDIACLQELKITEADFPHDDLRAAGYEAVCSCQQGWNGVAVIAREKPALVTPALPGAEESGARFIQARVHGIDVVSVYVPNGKTVSHADFPLKLAWLDKFAAHLESRADKDAPLLVAGDVNVCPTDMDSFGGARFQGHIFHTPEERARIRRVEASGLVDLFRAQYPAVPGFSFWDYRAGCFHKNEGMRIDMLYATAPLARRVEDVFVDREFRKKGKPSGTVPSDHAPVVARLRD